MLTFHYGIDVYNNISTWADGSDEKIIAMIEAADNDEMNLSNYWAVGDERTFHLSAIGKDSDNGGGFNSNAIAQDVVMVLMNEGYMDQDGLHFVVGQKDCLSVSSYASTGNTSYSWNISPLRTSLNNSYYNSFDTTIKQIFKSFKVKTGYSSNSLGETTDKFALFAGKEVVGYDDVYSLPDESLILRHISYYKTAHNRIKTAPTPSSATYTNWWCLRSRVYGSSDYYEFINSEGNLTSGGKALSAGVSPFGCI